MESSTLKIVIENMRRARELLVESGVMEPMDAHESRSDASPIIADIHDSSFDNAIEMERQLLDIGEYVSTYHLGSGHTKRTELYLDEGIRFVHWYTENEKGGDK